ncbi:MAG: family 78 glycoside hydrolase catalytic domain, partial [Lentisphaerae bacterium]|nr:family 78 glycoside hydrolase catalytic domain [Lentisphaerota bacterium]
MNISKLSVEKLTCNGLVDPQGIGYGQPEFAWVCKSSRRGAKQCAYQIHIVSDPDQFARAESVIKDTGKVQSEDTRVLLSDLSFKSRTRCYWKVRVWDECDQVSDWSRTACVSVGLLDESDWSAHWIGMSSKQTDSTSPWFRKEFVLDRIPTDARVYFNVLGYGEVFINGQKLGNEHLFPHVSDYGKRNFYTLYDAADLLHEGKNCISVWLGLGWYRKGLLWNVQHTGPVMRLQLEMADEAGRIKRVVTNTSWVSRPSNISTLGTWQFMSFGGERMDARADYPDWNRSGAEESGWSRSVRIGKPEGTTVSQNMPPNRILETVQAKGLKKLADGIWAIEMEKALTGFIQIEFPVLEKGQEILIEPGDAWLRKGKSVPFQKITVDDSINAMGQRNEYVARGSGKEFFQNRFNFASFRYLKISNLTARPNIRKIKGHLISADLPAVGRFECSSKMLNQIDEAMKWTLRCLMLGGYQVDCHSRERLGYGGDGHSSLETTLTSFRSDVFYRKWTQDWLDAQREDGGMPHTAPCPYRAGGGPFWCGFIIAATWRHYLHYGDMGILAQNYDGITKWLGYVEKHTRSSILEKWDETNYRAWYLGDWAVPPGVNQKHEESVDLFCNCFAIYILDVASKIADALGMTGDAAGFRDNLEKRQKAVHKKFYNSRTKSYADGDQIDYVMPLMSGVVPSNLKKTVFNNFENRLVVHNKGHLETGLSGTYLMIQYLQSIGRNDLIYEFASKTTMPSWGYMIR